MKKLMMVILHYAEISTIYLWIQTPILIKLIFLSHKVTKLVPNIRIYKNTNTDIYFGEYKNKTNFIKC